MKVLSNWRAVRLWESGVERELHRRHSLRTHGIVLGSFTLLLMWAVAAALRWAGVEALSLRYALTLGAGWLGYLAALRWWAQRLVARRGEIEADADVIDAAQLLADALPSRSMPLSSVRGSGASDLAGGALEAAGSADEGAVIVVPVLAVFLIGLAVVAGAGALVLAYFGSEALLAVAIELAFSYVSARAAVRVAREGWLLAAVRLTWKPLLGALLCAVLLGALLDHFMPRADSLPEAVRMLLGHR